ncbi:MAG: VOC family protein [Fibrobacter sp.]|nr:VOC family protein [Fibrobacter sp.]
MFKRIAHVCLYVKDLKRSIDYYSRLGFTVVFKFTRNGADFGAYMQIAPENYIEIFEDKNSGQVINNGIAHFCLQTEDIDLVMDKLTLANIQFTPKKLGCDNTYQIWLTDPDGNQFEVHQYTDRSSQITGGDSIEADW